MIPIEIDTSPIKKGMYGHMCHVTVQVDGQRHARHRVRIHGKSGAWYAETSMPGVNPRSGATKAEAADNLAHGFREHTREHLEAVWALCEHVSMLNTPDDKPLPDEGVDSLGWVFPHQNGWVANAGNVRAPAEGEHMWPLHECKVVHATRRGALRRARAMRAALACRAEQHGAVKALGAFAARQASRFKERRRAMQAVCGFFGYFAPVQSIVCVSGDRVVAEIQRPIQWVQDPQLSRTPFDAGRAPYTEPLTYRRLPCVDLYGDGNLYPLHRADFDHDDHSFTLPWYTLTVAPLAIPPDTI